MIGVFVKPFPDDQGNEADAGNDGKRKNEMRPEPVVLLPLVEHHLQRAHAEGEQSHADIVDLYPRARRALHPGRVFDQAKNQKQRQDAHRQVDEENPAPGIVVRDPAAQGGPDRRRDDGGDAIEREGHAALPRRKSVRQDGLRHGLQSAPARALQHAKQNNRPEAGRNPAQQRTHGEDHQTHHEESLAAEHAGEPSADGQHDGIRNQVGSEHPGALVVARAQAARHVGQRDIGDARVEHLHEGRHGDHDADHPRIDLRHPWFRSGSGVKKSSVLSATWFLFLLRGEDARNSDCEIARGNAGS